jgi:hypothetical protein
MIARELVNMAATVGKVIDDVTCKSSIHINKVNYNVI